MTLLRVENLSRSFGGIKAIDDLSLTIRPGPIHSIIGPNGAGKTTLFNLISGIYKPGGGRIVLEDADITGHAIWRLAELGLARTFQNLQIFFNMSAIENVMVGMHLKSDSRFITSLFRTPGIVKGDQDKREEAIRLLEFVDLGDYLDADTDSMPYGALKRLEIARALATQPRIIMLDEPAAGLNPAETVAIDGLIQKISENGITVILVEHDMRLVMGVSEHIFVLEGGRMLAEGTVADIRNNPDVVAAYLGESGRDR
ncbi:MAG: ABC transporter ATP-binding protein [Rhodospirillaceae bacterium]|jgi:branched-chain amino acid transport system ATP-binding protein|nr:ABC transporter ATP-binding protein [Rhodospirillaceae bacterium]MBT4219866.1 ABC transporter ATP-binding protein [Rhodospirillaceae bacterium]MBT5014289.1 ABC transporter ATP-binding protein [Rhodospirillaceae bacterium]MBT5308306.1 ABC transporter ATP-binding protein [Rhodospirillaceae bacterium]MBT6407266.1 ABC transporter ATP-binding protein [Rhodospirillaceae bacterium]